MSNSSFLFALTEEFYPINKNYYFAAIQYVVSMSIALIPNLFFLYATFTCSAFKKRQILKRTVLVFNILNIICIVTSLTISSYYLNGYYNGGLIRVNICFYMRRIQLMLMTLLVTTPLVFTVERYFTVFSRNNFQKCIAFAVFILVNFPSFVMFATMFFQSDIAWVPDEICTLIKSSTSSTVNKIIELIYYFTLGVPLIVGIINFFMIKRLNSQASTCPSSKSKQNENKTIFINLIIQTLQPFIGQWPSILFYFYLQSSGNNIYIVWRILDGLTALSLVSNILFSIVFIKDVRNTIFRRTIFRRISIKVVNEVTNVAPIKNDSTSKFKHRKSLVVKTQKSYNE
uniref:G_PROTEIN_RECEP_F1_2 domain-containing protein n=1 Tax=Strongyloides venezuelensis TaxID=75913 RepID=A0A0K0FKY8_STRVS